MSMIRMRKQFEKYVKLLDIDCGRGGGYNPNWSIADVDVPPAQSTLEAMSFEVLGNTIEIKDDFMGRIALLMGYKWIFYPTDEEIEQAISHFKAMDNDRNNTNKIEGRIIDNLVNSSGFEKEDR